MGRKIPSELGYELAAALHCNFKEAVTLIFSTIDHMTDGDEDKMTPRQAVNYLIALKGLFLMGEIAVA